MGQAKAAADGKVNRSISGGTGAKTVVRSKAWIADVNSLTLDQLQAATSGDDHWSDIEWTDLSDSEKAAWTVLGWGQESWGDGEEPESAEKSWEELSDEQRQALRVLGYDQETWDD